jgi:hypothetical protein
MPLPLGPRRDTRRVQESNLLGCDPVDGLARRSLPGRPTLPCVLGATRTRTRPDSRPGASTVGLRGRALSSGERRMAYVDRAGFEPAISRLRAWRDDPLLQRSMRVLPPNRTRTPRASTERAATCARRTSVGDPRVERGVSCFQGRRVGRLPRPRTSPAQPGASSAVHCGVLKLQVPGGPGYERAARSRCGWAAHVHVVVSVSCATAQRSVACSRNPRVPDSRAG